MSKKININDLFFKDLEDDCKFKPIESEAVVNFYKDHLNELYRLAEKRSKEYEETLENVSTIRIKGNSLDSQNSNSAIDYLATKFAEIFPDKVAQQKSIKEICDRYTHESAQSETPVFGLFLDKKDNTVKSLKPHNYFAEFNFVNFCQDMYHLIATGGSLGAFGAGEENIFQLISNVIELICSLLGNSTVQFDKNESLLIQTIIDETYAGRYFVSEDVIREEYQKQQPDTPEEKVTQMLDRFDELKVISIVSGNINLSEKLYFKVV